MKVLICWLAAMAGVAAQVPQRTPLDAAMHRIYSLDFAGGELLAKDATARDAGDPLAPAVLTTSRLFAELDRLGVLSLSPERVKRRPDAALRRAMQESAGDAIRRAEKVLSRMPDDSDALTALMLVHGAERDYLALVEKSYRTSWIAARKAQDCALRLLAKHPDVKDAWFTVGFSDYLIASAPFVFRPFMRMERADGDRRRGLENLERAAQGGRFLGGFARMILVNAYRKEGRKGDADRLLRELAREYPVNKAIQRELGDAGSY